MKHRVIVVGIVQNDHGKILLCRQTKHRGVYAGQWALPGGGIEAGETMYEALERELLEEVGLSISDATPYVFSDDVRTKISPEKADEELYMIYLLFDCRSDGGEVKLNEELDDYDWVEKSAVGDYDLNDATVKTFRQKGWL